ncbi:hypothetical protein Pelo_10880 [Pelomyxa schiedti]|nr:hypothetical protein Pelo_10880 [Pelomyxa schiedti]
MDNNSTSLSPDTNQDTGGGLTVEDVRIAGIVCSVFSLLGSSLVIAATLAIPSLRKVFRNRLVLYLSVSDSMWALTLLWDLNANLEEGTACNAAGFLLQWFVVCSDFLVLALAVSMFLGIVLKFNLETPLSDVVCICGAYVPTFGLALIPLFGGTPGGYGPRGAWCWIQDPLSGLLMSYMFAWIVAVAITILYILIIRHILTATRQVKLLGSAVTPDKAKEHELTLQLYKTFFAFPLCFIIQWIPATINRVNNLVHPDTQNVWLLFFHVVFCWSGGVYNSIVYSAVHRRTLLVCLKQIVLIARGKGSSGERARPVSMDLSTTVQHPQLLCLVYCRLF